MKERIQRLLHTDDQRFIPAVTFWVTLILSGLFVCLSFI